MNPPRPVFWGDPRTGVRYIKKPNEMNSSNHARFLVVPPGESPSQAIS
jgi:hypothetical protein